jgi:heterodisulfide reductase subunit B
MKYGLFLGCNMPAHRPDVEKAIRVSMPALGVELVDLEGYVCCPAFGTFASCDSIGHMAVAGWNLSIAEDKGLDLMVECGSCYSSLRTAREHMVHDPQAKSEVDRVLSVADRKYEGRTTVRHILDVLYHDVGLDTIRSSLERRLEGLHAVVQYPCHTLFPSEVVGFDNPPARPHILADLVDALGATVDHYSCEYLCCGGAGGFHRGAALQARDYARRKFDAIKKETKADLIVVSCVTCLMYMDKVQTELSNGSAEYSTPVFDYNQILALCQGFDPQHVARVSDVPRASVCERITSLGTRPQPLHRKE